MVRTALFEAAYVMLTRQLRFSAQSLSVAGRQAARQEDGQGGARPQARGGMHRIWGDGTTFRWGEVGVSAA